MNMIPGWCWHCQLRTRSISERAGSVSAPPNIMKLIIRVIIPDYAFHLGFAAKVGLLTTFADHADLCISWVPMNFTKNRNIVRRGADHFADPLGPSKR